MQCASAIPVTWLGSGSCQARPSRLNTNDWMNKHWSTAAAHFELRRGLLYRNTDFLSNILKLSNSWWIGRDSSVGIATRYMVDGPGIDSRWARDFPHPSRPALRPTRVILRGKADGVCRWPPTPSSAEVKERVEQYLCFTSGPVVEWSLHVLNSTCWRWSIVISHIASTAERAPRNGYSPWVARSLGNCTPKFAWIQASATK